MYNASPSASTELPLLSDSDYERLGEGGVVSHRQSMDINGHVAVQRVSAFVVVPAPRLRVWVATLGSGERHSSRLTEVPVSMNGAGSATWYQRLDLPWPFKNRHWLINTEKNTALAEEADDLVWEHRWCLATDSIDEARAILNAAELMPKDTAVFDNALYLTINQGAWVMMPLDQERTLVVVYATAELGGRLPDRMVARMIRKQLQKTLSDLTRRATLAETALAQSDALHTGAGEKITSLPPRSLAGQSQ